MNDARVSVMPAAKCAALGLLRQHAEIDVAADGGRTWVRVMRPNDDVERALHNLPGAEHFVLSANGGLIPLGMRVPIGRLPELRWQMISSFVKPALPPAALAGRGTSRCRLALRRSSMPQVPNLLVTDLSALVGYGCAAAEVRLNRWRFAVRADGQALVWGEPLPSLPGQLYVERERVAVPAGWQIIPARHDRTDVPFSRDPQGSALPARPESISALDSNMLAQVLNIGPGELVLFRHDASIERIGADDLIRASRSALRASLEAIRDE